MVNQRWFGPVPLGLLLFVVFCAMAGYPPAKAQTSGGGSGGYGGGGYGGGGSWSQSTPTYTFSQQPTSSGWNFSPPNGYSRSESNTSVVYDGTLAGTVSITFTWNGGTNNEPPPQSAVVTETMQPSAISYIGSTPTGTRTTNTGLPGNVTTRYEVKTVSNGSFTVTSPTMSASVSGAQGNAHLSIGMTASASKVVVNLGGGIGTDWSKRYLIGQQATASLNAGGLTPTSYSWSADGGNPFKNWTASQSGTTPSTTQPSLGTETGSQFQFHFKTPTPGGTRATVTCSAHLAVPSGAAPAAGLDVNVSRDCAVEAPSATLGVHQGSVQVSGTPPNYVYLGGAPGRTNDVGIYWLGTVTTPQAFVTSGSYGRWNWTQLITMNEQRMNAGIWEQIATTIPPYLPAPSSSYSIIYGVRVLDGYYPYPEYDPRYSTNTGGWYPADGTEDGSDDTPGEDLEPEANITEKTYLDSFNCYMMYEPPGGGSVAVPLRKVVWFWKFHATKSGGVWSVPVDPTYAQWSFGAQYPEFPLWNQYHLNNLFYVVP